ncbi:hypothetical protein Avbf_03465 [Armadillidium vulgare]|nr:hypothetical protein Avbf_03465 [Armadillidium vulgare]
MSTACKTKKDKPSFIATIEQTRDIPAGSRNLFEVTLSDMGKKSPREGELLVTEINNAVKEDGDMYVRRGRSHVKKEKILIKRSNLDGKSVRLRSSNARERVARMREIEHAPTRSVWDSQMYINNMHRKYVRKKASIHQRQFASQKGKKRGKPSRADCNIFYVGVYDRLMITNMINNNYSKINRNL